MNALRWMVWLVVSPVALVWADERQAEVWFDRNGNPVRLTEVAGDGRRHPEVVELDESNRSEWEAYLDEIGVEWSASGVSVIEVDEPLGAAHQLMQWRGFDERAWPAGWSVRRDWYAPRSYWGPGWHGFYRGHPRCGRRGHSLRYQKW